MVVVELTDPNTKIEYSYYMDNNLKRQLDARIIPALTQQDEDYVVVVDGAERMGKSVFAMQLAKYIDPSLNIDRVCFSPEEFKNVIITAKPHQAVIYDEAYRGLSSRSALSEVNKLIVSLMTEMGQKNLFVIVVLPTFFLLDKYVALWRARGLFHIYKKGTRKGNWTFFNRKSKQKLFLTHKKDYNYNTVRSNFKGRFLNKYTIDEEVYRTKKALTLKKSYDSDDKNKVNHFMVQRDKIINAWKIKQGLSNRKMAEELLGYGVELSHQSIAVIARRNGGRPTNV